MKLWEINDQIENLIHQHSNMETGELDEEWEFALNQLDIARHEKILAVAKYALGEKTEGNAVKEQADRLARRAKIHANRAERMRAYLAENMAPDEKYKDDIVQVSFAKNPPGVYVDEKCDLQTWPLEFVKIHYEPRKKALLEAINRGDAVPPGVEKIQGSSLRIR